MDSQGTDGITSRVVDSNSVNHLNEVFGIGKKLFVGESIIDKI